MGGGVRSSNVQTKIRLHTRIMISRRISIKNERDNQQQKGGDFSTLTCEYPHPRFLRQCPPALHRNIRRVAERRRYPLFLVCAQVDNRVCNTHRTKHDASQFHRCLTNPNIVTVHAILQRWCTLTNNKTNPQKNTTADGQLSTPPACC